MKKLAFSVILLTLFLGDNRAVAGFQLSRRRNYRLSSTTAICSHSKCTSDGHDGSNAAVMMKRRNAIEYMAGIATSSLSGGILLPGYSFADDILEGAANVTAPSVSSIVKNVTEVGVVAEEEEVTMSRDTPTKEDIQNTTKTTAVAFTTFNIIPDSSEALDPKLVEVNVSTTNHFVARRKLGTMIRKQSITT